MAQDPDDVEGVVFALVVYREENVWRVEEIGADRLHDVDDLSAELRRWPGDFGSLGLISIDEDFFVLGRVAGSDARWLLSDVTAATEWPLARSVVEALEIRPVSTAVNNVANNGPELLARAESVREPADQPALF